MKRTMRVAVACALGVTNALGVAHAQDRQNIQIPLFQAGTMIGRDGAAFGPGLVAEINPIRRLGLYGFAGTSSVRGYGAGNGITANFSDRTLGFGIECRVWNFGSRVTLGAFSQAAYYGSRVQASYPDGNGGTVLYSSSDRDPLVTIGPSFEFRVVRKVVVFIRPGKDFGDSFAATTAGGFSLNGGILVSVRDIAGGIKKASRFF
jgi:hypothetical protein